MPRIVADAIHDAELANVVIECEFKITQMSYYEFELKYNSTSEGQVGGVPSQRTAAAASTGGVALSTEARDDVDEELMVGHDSTVATGVSRPASPSREPDPEPEPEMPIGGSE